MTGNSQHVSCVGSSSQLPDDKDDNVFLWFSQPVVSGIAKVIARQSSGLANRAPGICTELSCPALPTWTQHTQSKSSLMVFPSCWAPLGEAPYHTPVPLPPPFWCICQVPESSTWEWTIHLVRTSFYKTFILQIRNWRQGLVARPVVSADKYVGVFFSVCTHKLFSGSILLLTILLVH